VIELKSPAEIERMRVTGAFVAEVLADLKAKAAVGVNLLDLEHHTRALIRDRGAESCYWNYAPSFGRGPFRNTICLSVNDAVLHGLPHDYPLRDGDVLSMDLAVSIDGWVADAAVTIIVGTPTEADVRLVRATEDALAAAVEATGSATSRQPSPPWRTTVVTGSTHSSEGTGSGAPCMRNPTSPIAAVPAGASCCARV
jgi:methionyl aminopeptidase